MDLGSLGSAASPELELVTGATKLLGTFFGNVSDGFGAAAYFADKFPAALAKGFMK